MKNLKYWKTVSETKINQIRLSIKAQIEKYIRNRSPIQTRTDSESKNLDPIQNNHTNNHKTKINIQLNQRIMIEESEYVYKYIF